MVKVLSVFALALVLSACTTDTAVDTNDPGGFTPPSTPFFKVDGIEHTVSADKSNFNAGTIRVTKAFMLDGASHNAALNINLWTGFAYRDSVKAGYPRPMHITAGSTYNSRDSINLYCTMDFYPQGVYELQATSGKVYLSMANDTIQVTSAGPITVTGLNTQPPYESQTRTVEFHLRNQVSF